MQRRLRPAAAALLAVVAAAVAAAPALAHDHHGEHPVRAALPPGAIKHIFVVELENESEASTFGPTSPATYLNDTLLPQGEFLKNYYATGHVSLDNYIAQISGQAPTEETGADCLSPTTSATTLVGSYSDLLPGTLDPNQQLYPGQVDGHGCVYPASVQTIANQLDALHPPNPRTHLAAWRAYAQDMGNQTTGRETGAPDPLGGLDCAHPQLGGVDNTNVATPSDQYATRHNGFVDFHQLGLPIPSPAPGGGLVGAVLLNRRYIEPGNVDTTGFYNHYSALRNYEDLLGITSGGNDGLGHLGFASSPGLQPFGPDVFTRR
ncbi:MAG TPA: hypothetical protein VG294_07215 [Solirubrobacteraceae bacterium]|jgi:hypothetical protein|nr:hypothetical protein [Solirubrobacteraceae bacterium]